MKLSVSAYRAHASAHKKILSNSYQSTLNYGSTSAAAGSSTSTTLFSMDPGESQLPAATSTNTAHLVLSHAATSGVASYASSSAHGHLATISSSLLSPPLDTSSLSAGDTRTGSMATSKEEEDSSNAASSDCKSPGQRSIARFFGPTTSLASQSSLDIIKENDDDEWLCCRSTRCHRRSRAGSPAAATTAAGHLLLEALRRTSSGSDAKNRNDYEDLSTADGPPFRPITQLPPPTPFTPQAQLADSASSAAGGGGTATTTTTTTNTGGGVSPSDIYGGDSEPWADDAPGGHAKGAQGWRNVRAVMAYYNTLRKIKRDVAFRVVTKSNQRWMKLRTTVQISSAMQKKPVLKREDSFLKRFSTRQIPETQETMEETGSESASGDHEKTQKRRRRYNQKRRTVVNPDENFHFYWLMLMTGCVLYNLWTLIVRQSFPELQELMPRFWFFCDCFSDFIFLADIAVQLRTGYLEQGLMVYDDTKLAMHYMRSRDFLFDLAALVPLDLLQLRLGTQPLLRFPRFFKVYRSIRFYYIVESRTVWPNLWRVVNLIHILLILAHWFGCFYFLLSEAEGFQGDWVYPYRPGDYATLTRKYLGSLYWSTLTLTTIGDLPTPETNAEYIFTIVSYLIGVFIFATIVGQVGNVITNRNANRLEFERLLDGAKTYMRHHKVPGGMKRRVLRWYDYSWSRGRIQGGGDINTALGLLPDKLKTELALHVNLSVLKKVTIFQECQPEFLHDLVLKMKAYIFTPGDSICRKGEVAREMFIIADGILEVLSETGKVLTTMKAGDFFGEIGILNLDGLNKRTADVRSVGYSELFSLSREDVLTAMKDYPEAQEILQTLGRKRLMEVRCVNKKHAKHLADKESIASNVTHANVVYNSENSTSKRIVDKLRSDVKGLKNALRKSRTGRRSNESIELQPLQANAVKGVLRRMPRVRSDDIAAENDDSAELKEKTPSPIGAGLPLLQRLLLLKEKQDREDRAVNKPAHAPSSATTTTTTMITTTTTTTPTTTTPHTHCTSAVSPQQQSIQEEPEREVVGAGLPLMQRLKLLKAKEERLAKESRSKMTVQSAQVTCTVSAPSTSVTPTVSAAVQSKTPAATTTTSFLSPCATMAAKAAGGLKVSFRERIKALQQDSSAATSSTAPATSSSSSGHVIAPKPTTALLPEKSTSSVQCDSNDLRQKLISSSISSKSIGKPSTLSIKEKLKQFSHGHIHGYSGSTLKYSEDSLKPWSKLKLATVVSTGGSYSSLSSSMNEESPTDSKTGTAQDRGGGGGGDSDPGPQLDTHLRSFVGTDTTGNGAMRDEAAPVSDVDASEVIRVPKFKARPRAFHVQRSEPKNYKSVDDLSPEYSGLPFVKKLKILNERQKLAELESAIQTRSFSLDSAETTGNAAGGSSANATDLMESLIRSHSEASGIARPKKSSIVSIQLADPGYAPDHRQHHQPHHHHHQCLNSPLSPESNETVERRQLKSILKKMSDEKNQLEQMGQQPEAAGDLNGQLMHAPTLEGPPHSARSEPFTASDQATLSHFPEFNAQLVHKTTNTQISTASLPPANIAIESPSATADTQAPQALTCTHKEIGLSHADDADITQPGDQPIVTKKSIKGSMDDHEFFGEVLLGIKHVIQNHLREVQMNFQDRFLSLELDIRQRDDVIAQLQNRIHELERIPVSPNNSAASRRCSSGGRRRDSTTSGSTSGDILFVRGDSIDTIYGFSPPYERARPKHKSKKRSSPRRRAALESRRRSKDDDTDDSSEAANDKSTISRNMSAESIQSYQGLQVLAESPPPRKPHKQLKSPDGSVSVVLDIDSSDSSTEAPDLRANEDDAFDESPTKGPNYGDGNDEDEDEEVLHCDDWEVRMLAAEMNRRESQQQDAAAVLAAARCADSHMHAGDEHSGRNLRRRRRKAANTTFGSDTELSDPAECQQQLRDPQRPRAASLDQHNWQQQRRRSRSVYKAMSFDRDKDRL